MNTKSAARIVLESFFMTWALSKVSSLTPGNIITGVIFIFCFLFLLFLKKEIRDKKEDDPLKSYPAVILAGIFTFLYLVVDNISILNGLDNRIFRLVMMCAVSVGLFLTFYHVTAFLFYILSNGRGYTVLFDKSAPSGDSDKKFLGKALRFFEEHMFICTFVLCIVFYLPYFLYLFPGVLTPDSIVQYEQVMGIESLSNHHPVAHTFFIGLFYRIGHVFTDDNTVAASFYTAFQILFMSFCASYFVSTLKNLGINRIYCLIAALFYSIVPYNAVFVSTVWKDVPFAGIVLLFVCSLIKGDLITLVISGTGFCLFRSNGFYAYAVLFVILTFLYVKKMIKKDDMPEEDKKSVLSRNNIIALCCSLLIAVVIKYPVYNSLNIEKPDFVESLSIPLQQVASVICYNGDLLPEDRKELSKIMDLDHVRELYEPTFADNIKELVRAGDQKYLCDNKGKFLKIYLRTFVHNPNAYLKAYVQQTVGYYFPDEFYLVGDAEGVSGSKYGISHTPLIGGPFIKYKEVMLKLGNMIPIYSYVFSMGVILWIMLFFVFYTIHIKKYMNVLYYLPFVLLVLTVLLATPVATEFRYVYFLVYALPLYPVIPRLKNITRN